MSDNLIVDSGKIVKMEVDYSSTCDEKIPECKEIAASGRIQEAIDILLGLEKQARTGCDMVSTSRVLVAIVQICRQANDWSLLNEHIVLLTKRRSQLKQAVAKMIQECCEYVDQTPTKDVKIKLIDTLRQVTEGKIYVEVERARLTHKLSKIREDEGNIVEAATIMQDLQIETYGSLDKKEKVELLLEQMRLCLAKNDYIRTQIISKKINVKFFEDEQYQDLKLKYYTLMMKLDQHEGSYLETCKHYRAVLNTPSIQDDLQKKYKNARCVVLYVILASHDNEQWDLMHRILSDKIIEEIPIYKKLLVLFTTSELIKWNEFHAVFEKELKTTEVFSNDVQGNNRWKEMKNRVIEHNIRVMAKYYTRIELKRMAELLDLTIRESEEYLSNLVVSKVIEAKTDRLSGIVHFTLHKDPNVVLNEWSSDLTTLMQLVNKTTHSISKEECIYQNLINKAN